jgi:beta-galactosidase
MNSRMIRVAAGLLFSNVLIAQLPAATLPDNARTEVGLREGWRFTQILAPGDPQSAAFDDSQWTNVTLPHTWNRIGNEGLTRARESNSYQGAGWYRLRFPTPAGAAGHRAFLQFDGVGAIADAWVNGKPVGHHEGAFSRFRFDVTAALNASGENLLLVKADNSKAQAGSPTEHVIPLSGDFFVFGGLYRNVSLILTAPMHVDMTDFGGPGVYGRTISLNAERATVSIAKRITNDSLAVANVTVATSIEDAAGRVVASDKKSSTLAAGATATLSNELQVERPRRWQGTADPYMYRIVVDVLSSKGDLLDEVRQPLGLRMMAFDANTGFSLNGEHLLLLGASMHQDRPVKGWAVSRADRVADFDLLQEMGGNAVRLAHYQHDQIAYELADARGIVAWAEIPLVNQVSLDGSLASEALIGNARQQLNELIRQNFNHPSIAVWSVANEIDLRTTGGNPAHAGPLLRALSGLAKQLDPSRLTTHADCCEQGAAEPLFDTTDVIGYNRYFGWYSGNTPDLGPFLDKAHAMHPRLPMAISEYGAGAALTQHSDNALGGPIDSHGRPHPEEVQMLFHEDSWRQIHERPFLWGVFIWNMFDFSSDSRNEGDLTDINEKGLVSYDRAVKKDTFYFYKANWNHAPTLHLTGRRYIDRAYGIVDVKAYSNAKQAQLVLNGNEIGTAACSGGICVWPQVKLSSGLNQLVARAEISGTALTDSIQWIYSGSPSVLRIKAGDVTTGFAPDGTRVGSDNFFVGGEGKLNRETHTTYREGEFAYDLPLPDGEYVVTARFTEPTESAAGKRVFDVLANGQVALTGVDPFALAGGTMKPVDKRFKVRAANGHLRLEFRPRGGKAAVVSALDAVRSDSTARSVP